MLAVAMPAAAADPLAEARRQYNLGNYVEAERYARDAASIPASSNAAGVVLGRVQLERYRQTADPADLASARDALRIVDPRALDARERVELVIGLAEALYLEDKFGAAADLFESVLERSGFLGVSAQERVLDWWATAVDRQAQGLSLDQRRALYFRVLSRMRTEIAEYPGSTAAGYWLAAAPRASGQVDEAWHAATAGWVRAALAEDRGATLRADLDRLVLRAIIPERAARLSPRGDAKQVEAVMVSEWEAFKTAWSR
jgi:hypothetical protein